ncbi:MAG: hypothetical protein A2735_01595 [Candidatus Yanofskybacteria bacterium RIFCSPHIGHO2_01_FULL_41_21]|uniref:Uncharacterized protein n=2 Tax=Candidatus Yanofskyibacteriota TaxID=1752733 RepID=A0A0G0WIE6_9BACT|nr:MAG: hypothetical protein UU70_C0036G0002 [Candidatus Yanofskybacteria bacterium GW2011_GWA1_41_6]OGM97571.1 MAG: hypothetical protein A2735_01595 [Candidatus Yanofskybacteria bacterium RIFCSPHIGHO2_01_FULL_41_21]
MRITDVSKLRGPLGELNDQLFGENGEERLQEFNLWLKGVTAKLLKHVGDIVLGSIETFDASKKFTKANVKVKFYGFGTNFEKNFGTKVENNVGAETIAVYRLEESARDPEIMTELGPEKRTIKLAQFYGAIEAQGQGQKGLLRVDGYANIAYIEDMNRIVWAVCASWDAGDGWDVDADSVVSPDAWSEGFQVLARKSA